MDVREICGICREDNCNFETRCGHLFHEECLKVAVFSKASRICPYCRCEISTLTLLERIVRANGDFASVSFVSDDIYELKKLVKYGFVTGSLPLELIVQKMVELGWDINEQDNWLSSYMIQDAHSLFYASYFSKNPFFTRKLIELGCELDENVFIHAVKLNDISLIEILLRNGADLNSFKSTGQVLCEACKNNNFGMVNFLLENGAKLTKLEYKSQLEWEFDLLLLHNSKHTITLSPLVAACMNGSINIIRMIHRHNPSIFKDDSVCWDAFAVAIKNANIHVIKLLIELGGNINSTANEFGRSLLMIACSFGNIALLNFLLDNGSFDLNYKDALGNSAILYSTKFEVVKFLIEKGADPLAKIANDNFTVLHMACKDRNMKMIEYLLNETAFSNVDLKTLSPAKQGLVELILKSEYESEFEIVDLLLQKGFDINEKNLNNEEAFSKVFDFSTEGIYYFLSKGANVNSINSAGMNCLQKLLFSSNPKDSDQILEHDITLSVLKGIDLNHQDINGWTTMHFVCKRPYRGYIIEYFLDSGARTDIPNNDGLYPFDFALMYCSPFGSAVKMMESRGLNFSKDIPEEVRSHPCDVCNNISSSLKTRCGHHIHIKCTEKLNSCPICGTRITSSNSVEKMIDECNFKDLASIKNQDFLVLLENYIEDEHVIDFHTLTKELKRRKKAKIGFTFKRSIDDFDLYAKACAYGRLRLIKFIDSNNIYSCKGSDKKCRAVLYASASRNIEIMEYFIEKFGRKYVKRSYKSNCPIIMACLCNNVEMFDLLVQHGAKLHVSIFGMSLLHLAVISGSLEIVKRLIEQHRFYIGRKFLFENVISKERSFYEEKLGIDVIDELVNFDKQTEDKFIEMAKYLLDHGADIESFDEEGETLVSLTGSRNFEKAFDFLVDYSQNALKKPLQLIKHKNILISIAICGKNMQFFEKVINIGADVNWTDGTGYTALMAACAWGNYEMCSKLVEMGANVNAREHGRHRVYTVLHHLCEKGDDNVQILELLVAKGADIHLTESEGKNALHIAAENGYSNTVKKLLAFGIDPNCRTFGGGIEEQQTPLHLTLENQDRIKDLWGTVTALVEGGADIKAEDEDGFAVIDILPNHSVRLRNMVDYFKNLQQSSQNVLN